MTLALYIFLALASAVGWYVIGRASRIVLRRSQHLGSERQAR